MILTKKLSRPTLRWTVKKVEFVFDDQLSLANWVANPRVHFEIDAWNADDNGEAIFERPEFIKACHYDVTPEIADLKIELGDDGPIISADIEVLLPVREELDEETLDYWFDELGGFSTATIMIDDNAAWAIDDGSWFYLSHND